MVAQEALPDEVREAARSQWQVPLGERRDKADRRQSPCPFGFRRYGPGCGVAHLANMRKLFDAARALHPGPSRPKPGSWSVPYQPAKIAPPVPDKANGSAGLD